MNHAKAKKSPSLVGLIKGPDIITRSPQMHNAAFKYLKMDWEYLPLSVKENELEKILRTEVTQKFVGVNVTSPHKKAAFALVDEHSDSAKAISAINTIVVKKNGILYGDNTDANGFLADLNTHKLKPGKRAVVLGASGASSAIVYALATANVDEIIILNRTLDKAINISNLINPLFSQINFTAAKLNLANISNFSTADIIINATTLGSTNSLDEMPWPQNICFSPHQIIYDLIYEPSITKLITKAKKDGAKALNGLGMLVQQGALSFTIWTRKEAPIKVMQQAASR